MIPIRPTKVRPLTYLVVLPGSRSLPSMLRSATASTRMACSPDLMAQENALHAAFARTTGYRIDGNALELIEGDAVLARFVARAIQ